MMSQRMGLIGEFRIEHQLDQPSSVSQINKYYTTMVSPPENPSDEKDPFAEIRFV
jgi:hypothetical protein